MWVLTRAALAVVLVPARVPYGASEGAGRWAGMCRRPFSEQVGGQGGEGTKASGMSPAAEGAGEAQGAGKAAASADGVGDSSVDWGLGRVNGINMTKGGEDPFLMPDNKYPPWLWTIHIPLPNLAALERKSAGDPFVNLTDKERRRYVRLSRTQKIKLSNASSKKKK